MKAGCTAARPAIRSPHGQPDRPPVLGACTASTASARPGSVTGTDEDGPVDCARRKRAVTSAAPHPQTPGGLCAPNLARRLTGLCRRCVQLHRRPDGEGGDDRQQHDQQPGSPRGFQQRRCRHRLVGAIGTGRDIGAAEPHDTTRRPDTWRNNRHEHAPCRIRATDYDCSGPGRLLPADQRGKCYQPGEFCRNSDHGANGVAGNGEAIICEDNDGWRWEPTAPPPNRPATVETPSSATQARAPKSLNPTPTTAPPPASPSTAPSPTPTVAPSPSPRVGAPPTPTAVPVPPSPTENMPPPMAVPVTPSPAA